jgi:tetratricopeptide (TPR) repeat protein
MLSRQIDPAISKIRKLIRSGDFEKAIKVCDKVISELKESKEAFRLGDLFLLKSEALFNLGLKSESEKIARDAVALYRLYENKSMLYRAISLYARILFMRGKFNQSKEELEEIINKVENYRPKGNFSLVAFIIGDVSNALKAHHELGNEVRKITKIDDSKFIELHINYYLRDGIFNLYLHKFSLSRESLRHALRVSRQVGWVREEAIALEFLGQLCYEMGRYKEALKHLDEALQIGMRVAPRGDIVNQVERRRAEVFIRLGRLEEARFAMDHAWEVT